MSLDAEGLSWALIELVRRIGVERGVDLVLHVLFVRWLTADPQLAQQWRDLHSASSHEERLERFNRLDTFRESTPERSGDSDTYPGALSAVVHELDDNLPPSALPVPAERAFLADTFDATLGLLSGLGKQAGEADTPRAVAHLMAALTVRPGDHVLDPVCGNGTTLLVAAQSHSGVSVSGLDINPRVARRASMRLMVHGVDPGHGFGIWNGEAFSEYTPSNYDVVLAQPPWNATFTDSQRTRILGLASAVGTPANFTRALVKGDIPWLFLALDALRTGGRAALMLAMNSLTPRNRESHHHLLQSDAVEAIITLPAGVFRHTGIPSALWLLRKGSSNTASAKSVLLVDAQSLAQVKGKGQTELSPDAIEFIRQIVAEYRETQRSGAPGHVARAVPTDEVNLERGLAPTSYLASPPQETVVHPVPSQSLLTHVELENFKAFGPRTELPLAPLTLIYGANSAGKSSVIQSLLLLKQSRASKTLVTQGPLLNVGTFQGIVHRHGGSPLSVSVRYGTLPDWISPRGTADPTLPRRVGWTFTSDPSGQGAVSMVSLNFGAFELHFTGEPEGNAFKLLTADMENVARGLASGSLFYPYDAEAEPDRSPDEVERRLANREQMARRAMRALVREDVNAILLEADGILPSANLDAPLPRLVSEVDRSILTSRVGRVTRLVAGIADEVTSLLDSIIWIGPLRSAPRRVYDRADTTSVPGDGRHVAIYLFDHASVVEQVNDWLNRLEIPYNLDVIPVNTGDEARLVGDLVAIALTDRRTGVAVTPADVGFGISQSLPIVVELLSNRESIIAIEQPETHLHPRLQARLADLFIDATQEGGQGNQLLIETHSEHLMLRVQRRIREGALDPRNVSVLYVDQGPDGETTVMPLRLSEQGEFLDEWPHGFFDERLDDLFGEL